MISVDVDVDMAHRVKKFRFAVLTDDIAPQLERIVFRPTRFGDFFERLRDRLKVVSRVNADRPSTGLTTAEAYSLRMVHQHRVPVERIARQPLQRSPIESWGCTYPGHGLR